MCLVLPLPGEPAAGERETRRTKAVWMLNFVHFIEWPTAISGMPDRIHVVGILGKDSLGREIESAIASKGAGGRRFEVRRVSRAAEAAQCHILFVPAGERRAWQDMQADLGHAPVLTVGEAEDFLEHGGIVNFRSQNGSTAFEIDLRHAQKAGLKIDANLLKIASKVRGKYD